MNAENNLKRFLDAQNHVYLKALSEIKKGAKLTHWMWFIFPQLKGLGQSEIAILYAIDGTDEAMEYLKHPVLGKHLVEAAAAVLQVEGKTATEIFGVPDDVKLRSCMTLFANVKGADPVFDSVIKKYFYGMQDEYTLQLLLKDKFSNDTV